jgi:hypothetical protein
MQIMKILISYPPATSSPVTPKIHVNIVLKHPVSNFLGLCFTLVQNND